MSSTGATVSSVLAELGPVRHVLDAAVGIGRLDEDLLRLAGLQPDGGRVGPSSERISGSAADGAGHPGGDPLGDHAVFERVGREPDSAAVLDGARRLEQEQALAAGAVLTIRRPRAWRVRTAWSTSGP